MVPPTIADPHPLEKENKVLLTEKRYFTLTINPSQQYFDEYNRVTKVRAELKMVLNNLPRGCNCNLYTELSEPSYSNTSISMNTQEGTYPRVHFHGTIYFESKQAWIDYLIIGPYILRKYHVNISNYKSDTLEDRDLWHLYCMKQNITEFYGVIKSRGKNNKITHKVFDVEECIQPDSDLSSESE